MPAVGGRAGLGKSGGEHDVHVGGRGEHPLMQCLDGGCSQPAETLENATGANVSAHARLERGEVELVVRGIGGGTREPAGERG